MSPDELTDAEAAAIAMVHQRYVAARESNDYALSDTLRRELIDAGVSNLNRGQWRAVYESSDRRQQRLRMRAESGGRPDCGPGG